MIKKYNKLIRDRVPEIIEKDGEIPHMMVVNGKEFIKALKKKLLEEAKELIAAKSRKDAINEIADILEIVDALTAQMKISNLEICVLRRKKNLKRGAFEKQLFLIKTETKPRA